MAILVSILIPSYKRVETLDYLMQTIPKRFDIEVILHSDNGPNWLKIEEICKKYQKNGLPLKFKNNKETLGLDQNIISLIKKASGEYIILMGDDDFFLKECFPNLIDVLRDCKDKKIYSILRSYKATIRNINKLEMYRYSDEDELLPKGKNSAAWVFKRSVSLAGTILHRETALENYNSELTGTLLIHAFLSTKAAIKSQTYLMSTPFAVARDTWREQDYTFGASLNEKRFTPGKGITIARSMAFINAYEDVCSILEKDHKDIAYKIKLDLSKYSYPFLNVQRVNGFLNFIKYCREVEKTNLICHHQNYYIYKYALLIFGEKLCSFAIRILKKIIGKTPRL